MPVSEAGDSKKADDSQESDNDKKCKSVKQVI